MSLFVEAVTAYSRGDWTAATQACGRWLRKNPNDVDGLSLMSVLHLQANQTDLAEPLLRRLLAYKPAHAGAHHMLGDVYRLQQKYPASIRHYQQALVTQPEVFEAWINLGLSQSLIADHQGALASCERALALRPGNAMALYNKANALQSLGQVQAAVSCYELALPQTVDDTHLRYNLGNALLACGRLEEATTQYRLVLARVPDDIGALTNCAVAMRRMGRFDEAIALLEPALRQSPDNLSALLTLANAFSDAQRWGESQTVLERALALAPNSSEAWYNLGVVGRESKDGELALHAFTRALDINANDVRYLAGGLAAAMAVWDIAQVQHWWARFLTAWPAGGVVQLDFLMQHTDDPLLLREAAQRLSAHQLSEQSLVLEVRSSPRVTVADRRVRLAYLSADFGQHPVGLSVVEMLERHDRSRFEVFGLSLVRHPESALTRRLQVACDQFLEVGALSTGDLARQIRDLNIDVAVDMAGNTVGGRPLVLAPRPATVQVGFLGYAHTTGAPWIDYLLVDGQVIGADPAQAFTEALAILPHCFFPTDTTSDFSQQVVTRATEGLPDEGTVFCCFNTPERITPLMMSTWMEVLQAVHGSVLWLRATQPKVMQRLREFAQAQGVAADRLVFARFAEDRLQHLARHRLADLYLDTFPYNSHSTGRDALYAGLPVLTLSGCSFASRVASSLLLTAGLPELITTTPADYVTRAVELARDNAGLNALRQRVTAAHHQSPLFDMARYTKDVERAYVHMMEVAEQGGQAAQFRVSDLSTR